MTNSSYGQTILLLKLNRFIQRNRITLNYHMNHIKLARSYAFLINQKLGNPIEPEKLNFVALAHDMFKEHGLNPLQDGKVIWNNHSIPQDLNRYVRMNLDILEEFGLEMYFNTDIQLHALAAGIFLYKECHVRDKELLYPIFFHSCPILSVYQNLDDKTKTMVDIMTLADKLSSNYLRINVRHHPVRVDLDKSVFGDNGYEFNYSLGLYLARLLAQGKNPDKQSDMMTEYYYKRLIEMNPLVDNKGIKKLGVKKLWPQRTSQVWKTQLQSLKM